MTTVIKYNPEAIKVLRQGHGLTPVGFARKVGVERQHVRAWENGTVANTDSLLRIANAFGLKSLDIFFSVCDYHSNNREDVVHTANDSGDSAGVQETKVLDRK